MSADPPSRRAEHAADTRAALVDAARGLFAERGFAATGTEDIVAAARVTRGALYHHFRDKTALFRAVLEQVRNEYAEALINDQLPRAVEGSPLDQIRAGFAAFLDACLTSGDFHRIVLVEGPIVFGQDSWDALAEGHGLALLGDWLRRAADTGEIAAVPVEPLARVLVAALTEASLIIVRSPEPAAARAEVGVVLDRLIQGLSSS
ncbi:MAG TPA: TetR family transcriptional regulator [Pseudonocardiaceae bacterium]|nr:TetR family transcriptional regulator [Pseudonocardiaceae bacterium]